MKNPGILTQDDLKAATGCHTTGALEDCLRKNGVRFLYGKKGIYTTIDALNAAMGLQFGLPEIKKEITFL